MFIIELQSLFKKKFKKIDYSTGKEIIEIKPLNIINKAKGLDWYLDNKFNIQGPNAKILCIGDDTTDEDMFELINSKKNGISIKIDDNSLSTSHQDTKAKIIFKSVNEVYQFLSELNKLYS